MENPNQYKRSNYTKNIDIEELYSKNSDNLTLLEEEFIEKLLNDPEFSKIDKSPKLFKLLKSHYRNSNIIGIKKNKILMYLRKYNITKYNHILPYLIKKSQKSQSGVLVVTVVTSPYPMSEGKIQKFSCQWDCHYCPKEPGQPRSYLHDEPSVLRANQNNFDPILQFTDRCLSLYDNGHPIDKIELLVLGGTWDSYPIDYRENFIRDLFYAANTFKHLINREKYSLEIEQQINETTGCRIIGLTLETRPDCINEKSIRHFRKLGCTRIQIGVQHTDDTILRKINRKCTTKQVKLAIKILKNNGFKVDIHLMTQLPNSNVILDEKMFNNVLNNPELQADQWKIYPCCITPWTKIKEWYDNGKYNPYSDKELIDMLVRIKSKVHPWIRLNRIFRDIPNQYILGGTSLTNLRQILDKTMLNHNLKCNCIRCREIGLQKNISNNNDIIFKKYIYNSSDGVEYFLSYVNSNNNLYGFLRLRINNNNKYNYFKSNKDTAFIRELHVYGNLVKVNNNSKTNDSQHRGIGKKLIKEAEWICWSKNISKISIIAGIGTRNYYRKLGYKYNKDGGYMIKQFNSYFSMNMILIYYNIILVLFISFNITETYKDF